MVQKKTPDATAIGFLGFLRLKSQRAVLDGGYPVSADRRASLAASPRFPVVSPVPIGSEAYSNNIPES
jgi:hypothetical protein